MSPHARVAISLPLALVCCSALAGCGGCGGGYWLADGGDAEAAQTADAATDAAPADAGSIDAARADSAARDAAGGDRAPVDAAADGGAACEAREALPMTLVFCRDAWNCDAMRTEQALVAWHLPPQHLAPTMPGALWLYFPSDALLARVSYMLPFGYQVPALVGETVDVTLGLNAPWWIETTIALRQPDGRLRLLYRDQAHQFAAGTQAPCPPVEQVCSTRDYPPLPYRVDEPDFAAAPVDYQLEQGEDRTLVGNHYLRLLAGHIYREVTVTCDDTPWGWAQTALLDNNAVSQCRCQVEQDCAADQVCDTHQGRCVPDRCPQTSCGSDTICDPYTGDCVAPGAGCATDDDCPVGYICNPSIEQCQPDICAQLDCPEPCSSLLGGCVGCLADCDCYPGQCDQESFTCTPGCDEVKVHLTQDNPEQYELYFVCVEGAVDDPAPLLQELDAELTCMGTAHPRCSDVADRGCLTELRYTTGGQQIAPEQWAAICALSRSPLVHEIVGGYFE